jgi:LPS export ABC transporter protein LptC
MSYIRKSLLIIFITLNLVWLAFSQLHVFNTLKIEEPHQLNFNALLSHVHWSEYDNQGIISHQFYAPLVKNISNHLNIIYSPNLRLQNDKETWQIKAKFAKTIEGLDTIELRKDVKIKHMDDKSKQPSFLLTENLTYHPKTQEAHTKAPVTFNQGDNVIHSQGMDANFSNSTHIKLGEVEGVYHPENSNTTG